MECPFCAETIKDEAVVCKHCSRDLRVVRPVIIEIEKIVVELDTLQRELDRTRCAHRADLPRLSATTAFIRSPMC